MRRHSKVMGDISGQKPLISPPCCDLVWGYFPKAQKHAVDAEPGSDSSMCTKGHPDPRRIARDIRSHAPGRHSVVTKADGNLAGVGEAVLASSPVGRISEEGGRPVCEDVAVVTQKELTQKPHLTVAIVHKRVKVEVTNGQRAQVSRIVEGVLPDIAPPPM